MTDMRPAFYVSLILVGWTVSTIANDPVDRISEVLQDEAQFKYYAQCFLDKGPCTADGRALKRLLPEFIATSCAKCSERYKQMACTIIFTLHQPRYADLWQEFLQKYDPLGHYQVNLEAFKISCKQNGYI